VLTPQDLLVLLKLHLWQGKSWRYSDLATSLGMSASEVHAGLKRSATAKLYNSEAQQVLLPHLEELLIHGLKYIWRC
jgi:DNA-binding Xre family transcriptional regulator